MRLLRHYTGVPADLRGAAVALGNFDGVHPGHQAVIEEAGRIARSSGVPQGVITFEPHPRSHFQPNAPPFRLTSFRTKLRRVEALGVDLLVVLRFDAALAAKPASVFVTDVLIDGLGISHLVVGDDFRFGNKRQGDVALLQTMGAQDGFDISGIAQVAAGDGEPFSSSRIRDYLRTGRPDAAAALLGHWWEIEARVQRGDQRGRQIGFPTANLALGSYLEPAHGVYAVRAGIDQGAETVWRDGVANFGNRPTVDGHHLLLEAHLFDFDGDLYGRHLRVALISHIRGERKFDGIEALTGQIAKDAREARQILAETPSFPVAGAP